VRPGGNATGFTLFEYAIAAKWLELVKEIAPGVTRVAVLRDPAIAAGNWPVRRHSDRGTDEHRTERDGELASRPHQNAAFVPARATYSHSASVRSGLASIILHATVPFLESH
jgi:hypothetical protein